MFILSKYDYVVKIVQQYLQLLTFNIKLSLINNTAMKNIVLFVSIMFLSLNLFSQGKDTLIKKSPYLNGGLWVGLNLKTNTKFVGFIGPKFGLNIVISNKLTTEISVNGIPGLILDDTIIYRPDIANGAILEQRYKGKSIAEGKKIPKGSVIKLVVGQGTSDVEVAVPDFRGKSCREIEQTVRGSGFIANVIWVNNAEFEECMVFKQKIANITVNPPLRLHY